MASFAVGILVIMVAALLPALRAARIPPVAAMREAATADRPLTRITVAGAAVTLAGGALLWAGLTDHAGEGNSLVALLVGLLLVADRRRDAHPEPGPPGRGRAGRRVRQMDAGPAGWS